MAEKTSYDLLSSTKIIDQLSKLSNGLINPTDWKFVSSNSTVRIQREIDQVGGNKQVLLFSPLEKSDDIYNVFDFTGSNVFRFLSNLKQLATGLDSTQIKLILESNIMGSQENISENMVNGMSQDIIEIFDDIMKKKMNIVLVPNPINSNIDLYQLPVKVGENTSDVSNRLAEAIS